ncbi:hypothetical protein TNCV_1016741 [Trichonephila clavipes]|uniref:Uncharacterized protein n=1 Tax=Trichonephila clavipes TaxID=2585209 RepID=A0A8X6VY62_TRICX|nr:hypothetical protein TNCV_1016741 [Trichonephila clavipes]
MKIHRLGPGLNQRTWAYRAIDKPTTPPSKSKPAVTVKQIISELEKLGSPHEGTKNYGLKIDPQLALNIK